MIKIIASVLLFTSCLIGNSQSRDNKFLGLIKELQSFKVPLMCSEMIKEVEFNEKEKRLNLEEWSYLKVDKKKWPFQKDYFYEGYGKVILHNSLIGIIYKRSFLPADLTKEKTEFVLATFSKEGKPISSLPIQGSYGDNMSFFGIINQNYEITINQEIFNLNKTNSKSEVTKKSEKYRLKPSGEVEKYL